MKNQLKTTKALVTHILERDAKARNSDNHLYMQVLIAIGEKQRLGMVEFMSVADLFEWLGRENCPFPPFESVRRARQKVQAEFPHLAASERVQEFRAENETAFREFARG